MMILMSFDRTKTLTIYGRKPVIEALENSDIHINTVHLADSNKPNADIKRIKNLTRQRDCELKIHNKLALSRISKNAKQDQGVAADIYCDNFYDAEAIVGNKGCFIAIDRIGNPQNLGMLIRSVAASGIAGLIISEEPGNTKISSLVIKASAGALFKCPIYKTRNLLETTNALKAEDFEVVCMDANANTDLNEWQPNANTLFILGNETEGISDTIRDTADKHCKIVMHNNVESLNVAVTASLVAFKLGG